MRWMAPGGVIVMCGFLGCGEAKPPAVTPSSGAPASAASDAPASEVPANEAPATIASAAPSTSTAAVTVAPVAISYTLTAAEQDARQALALKILDGQLKGLALRNRKNAVIFRDLAAKHPHPRVVAGGLAAMGRTFSTRKGQGTQVDEDYRKVVRVRMGASNPQIIVAALDAARLLLGSEPEPAFLDAVIALSGGAEPIGKTAAVRTLVSLPFIQSGEVKSPFYDKTMLALIGPLGDADDAARTIIMERLARTLTPAHANASSFAAIALKNRSSDDPGVKAAANLLLATTSADKAVAAKLLASDLKHPNAYVRGATLEALGLLGHAPAAHAIMPLLEDTADAIHSVDVEPEAIPLRLDAGRSVQAAALSALRALSKQKFDFKRGDLRKDPAAIVAAARAWFAKAGIPQD